MELDPWDHWIQWTLCDNPVLNQLLRLVRKKEKEKNGLEFCEIRRRLQPSRRTIGSSNSNTSYPEHGAQKPVDVQYLYNVHADIR